MQRIRADHVIHEFSHDMQAVAEVQPGEEFQVETLDCAGGEIHSNEDWKRFKEAGKTGNPCTGPIAIAGAEPGDALVVEILEIEPVWPGIMRAAPGGGFLGDAIEEEVFLIVEAKGDRAVLCEGLTVKIAPMIGVIGVAPAEGIRAPTSVPGDHGGNLDTKDVCLGAKISREREEA